MASDATVKDVIDKIRSNWRKAAEKALPKLAWMRELAGRHYSAVSKSKAWKDISRQYDAMVAADLDQKPIQLLRREIARIERQGEGLEQLDLAIIGMYDSINNKRRYQKFADDKNRRESEKHAQEIKYAQDRHALEMRKLAAEAELAEREVNDKDAMIEDDITLDGFTDSEIAEMKGTAGNEETPQEL